MDYTFKVYNSIYKDYEMVKTDFSNKLQANVVIKETLDETLSQCKITLLLTYQEEFAPGTRFFIDVCDSMGNLLASKDGAELHFDFVVERDIVESLVIADNNKFMHHLNLIESSATAQHILLPNNSLTWQLKDTVLRYYGIIPQENINGKYTSKDTKRPDPSYKKEYHFGFLNKDDCLKYVVTGLEGSVDGLDVNPAQNMPIVCADSDTIRNFTYNIPHMYLKSSMSDAFYEGAPLGYDWSYYNEWTSGKDELSTVTHVYIANTGVEIGKYYHNVQNSLHNDYPCHVMDFLKVNPVDQWEQSNGMGTRWQFKGTVGIPMNNQVKFANLTVDFNFNKIENYTAVISHNSVTINLLDNSLIGKEIRFVTVPVVRVFKYDNGFTDEAKILENPPFAEYIYFRQTLTIDLSDMHFEYYLPYVEGNTWGLRYEYKASAVKAGIKEETLTKKSNPYNAYEMFNKLQISYLQINDTGLSQSDLYKSLPYQFDDTAKQLAKKTILPEVSFSQKSLWDALLFLCSFLGAIPKIEAQVNSSQYIVHLRKLGDTKKTVLDASNLLTIYNSKDISECVTEIKNEYNNIMNSTGLMTEYLHCCSLDNASYVSVDNMCLRTKYRIDRLATFSIIRTLDNKKVDATDLVFNISNYNQLSGFYYLSGSTSSSSGYKGTIPNKGMCLYYVNGTNEIGGLQYKCPDEYTSALNPKMINCYAIKNFIWSAFHRLNSGEPDNPFRNKNDCYGINPNDYIFIVQYVPIINTEVSVVRPDLRKFNLNSAIYKYPMYQQRSQANDYFCEAYKLGHRTWGELIRMSNTIYTISDWFEDARKIHKVGEIYHIEQSGKNATNGEIYYDNNLYYINTIETEFTNAFATQSLTLSKDFNRLSQYIGLDSASRFYEVPERYCDRYIKENAFFYVYTEYDKVPSFINDTSDFTVLGKQTLLNYIFKKDNHYPEIAEVTFITDDGGAKTVSLPLAVLPIGGDLEFHFDCTDNFSAGVGYVGNSNFKDTNFIHVNQLSATGELTPMVLSDTTNNNGNSFPYYFPICDSYCDIFGRVKSYSYSIGTKLKAENTVFTNVIKKDLQALPLTQINAFKDDEIIGQTNLIAEELKIIKSKQKYIFKDAGERLLFTLNINIATGSDRFSFSRFVWESNINAVACGTKLVALKKEISKFDEPIISVDDSIATHDDASALIDLINNKIKISDWLNSLTDEQISKIESIAIVSKETNSQSYIFGKPLFYRNLGGIINRKEKTADWLFKFSN